MSDVLHRHAEGLGTVQGYASVRVTIAEDVVTLSGASSQAAEAHPADIEAFGRLLAAADMADHDRFGTDITHMSDEEYIRHLLG